MALKIEVLSHYLFDEKMKEMGLNDNNVEDTNMAFISIIGTEECLKYYLDEGNTKHYFKDHPNVLNLEFDDIGTDVMYNGHHFKTMRMEQAEKTVDFIETMIEKGVDVIKGHCRAGFSRSRAIFEFIYCYCIENGIEVEYSDRNDYTTFVNQGVLRRLRHAYWKKHNMNEYEDKNAEYPDDLLNVPIEVINTEE
jgi:protein-tyrosine phosphatase